MPILETSALAEDERWKLVLRILASPGFQRAGQLRAMLKYLVAECILHPERTVRELELAREVLGRGGDFDPVTDNIVRAQMSHLRRKLEAFYAEDGRHETLRVTMPKGSYQPHFAEITLEDVSALVMLPPTSVTAPAQDPAKDGDRKSWWVISLAIACGVLFVVCVSLWLHSRSPSPNSRTGVETNEFVKFLVRRGGPVSVILPDTSLVMLQNTLSTDITVKEYLRPDFLSEEIAREPDPQVQKLLLVVRDKRNTSSGESAAAVDIVSTLAVNGLSSTVRYARDMHTRDLGEGNAIIIGTQRSNPWATLFSDQINFRFSQGSDPIMYEYFNLHPLPGEQAKYVPYVLKDGKYSSYVDIVVCPNLTHSGYVILVNGSDMQGNEAAVRYLLHGSLPSAVTDLFSRRDLGVYEVFLQSRHAAGEAEESFNVVAVRYSK